MFVCLFLSIKVVSQLYSYLDKIGKIRCSTDQARPDHLII